MYYLLQYVKIKKTSGLEQIAKLWNLSSLLLQIMSKSPNVGILWEFKLCWSCVSVNHISLFSNLLSDSKSVVCLLKDLN